MLVTVFDAATGHIQLGAQHLTRSALAHVNSVAVHGLDQVFGIAALFSLATLAMIVFGVRAPRPAAQLAVAGDGETTPPGGGGIEEDEWLEREAG